VTLKFWARLKWIIWRRSIICRGKKTRSLKKDHKTSQTMVWWLLQAKPTAIGSCVKDGHKPTIVICEWGFLRPQGKSEKNYLK
jgi:hypothetical protein